MLYHLQHGDHEQVVLESWARGDFGPNVPMPDFLANKPRCPPWAEMYMDAYWDLNGDRAGMGDGRVLWTACHLWARAHRLSRRQEQDLVFYVKHMDTVLLEHLAKKKK